MNLETNSDPRLRTARIQGKVIDRLPGRGGPYRRILRANLTGEYEQSGL